jgi:hypothetical protein
VSGDHQRDAEVAKRPTECQRRFPDDRARRTRSLSARPAEVKNLIEGERGRNVT